MVMVGAGTTASSMTLTSLVTVPAEFLAVSVNVVATLTPRAVVFDAVPGSSMVVVTFEVMMFPSEPVTTQASSTSVPLALTVDGVAVNELITGFSTAAGGQAVKVAASTNKRVVAKNLRIISPCYPSGLES